MIGADGIHDGGLVYRAQCRQRIDVPQKIILQTLLITVVYLQTGSECFVVRISKRICGIVDQLSEGVVIEKPQLFAFFQTDADALHIPLGVAPIVAAKPLATEGAFQIGGRVAVRLDAADQESTDMPVWGLIHITLDKVSAEKCVGFAFHVLCIISIISFSKEEYIIFF